MNDKIKGFACMQGDKIFDDFGFYIFKTKKEAQECVKANWGDRVVPCEIIIKDK